MKILLVKPYNRSDHIQPSLGLGYLAGVLRSRHTVRIVDCIKEGMALPGLIDTVKREVPEVLGIQCYTFDLKNIEEILNAVKKEWPRIVTIVGGPHPSAVPEETMKRYAQTLDFAFVGEAERGLPVLLDMLGGRTEKDFSIVEGLVWRDDGRISVNHMHLEQDLDAFGLPAWDLIRPQEYPPAQHGAFFKKFPIAPIMVTRGCPYYCSFCAGALVSGTKIRRHSIGYILNEISVLYREYGIREFHMVDDNFTMDKAFAKELLKGIAGLGLTISWATPNGIKMETLDDELLELMKQSGLYLVSLGIESGSDRILKAMRKNLTREKIIHYVDKIHSHGIPVAGFFILGYIGETKEEIEETIRFSLKLGLIRANYFNFLPFPGTTSFKEICREEGCERIDFDRFYFMDVAYAPQGISTDDLRALQRRAFLAFYRRPHILIRNLFQVKSPAHFKFLFRRFVNWVVKK